MSDLHTMKWHELCTLAGKQRKKIERQAEYIAELIDELEVERETIAQLEAQIGMLDSNG